MQRPVTHILLILLALNTSWFVIYSAGLGVRGLSAAAPETVSRVFLPDAFLSNASLAVHMLAGALLTIAAPLQALPILRRRLPALHRRAGHVIAVAAVLTGAGGLAYIALVGTVGGPVMDVAFALYGGAVILAAVKTVAHARARQFASHAAWATRLVILAVGSWIYRMHYVIWYAATGGVASNDSFTGLFDQIQVFAFFAPYLLVAEWFLRRRGLAGRAAQTGRATPYS